LLASTLSGVVAQRLVRKLDLSKAASAGTDSFRGRTGIYEMLTVNESIRQLIHDGAAESAILDAARQHGMRTLREDGMRWVDAGITTREEVLRVTRDA
jgi:general secretion pathway protein E